VKTKSSLSEELEHEQFFFGLRKKNKSVRDFLQCEVYLYTRKISDRRQRIITCLMGQLWVNFVNFKDIR
jgi:hypothetical protein